MITSPTHRHPSLAGGGRGAGQSHRHVHAREISPLSRRDTGTVVDGNQIGLPGVPGSGGEDAINVLSTQTVVLENVVAEAEEGIQFSRQ